MIFVFKTSVQFKKQVKELKPGIDEIITAGKWNFDLSDCDKILRIDSEKILALKVKELLHAQHFFCEEID